MGLGVSVLDTPHFRKNIMIDFIKCYCMYFVFRANVYYWTKEVTTVHKLKNRVKVKDDLS